MGTKFFTSVIYKNTGKFKMVPWFANVSMLLPNILMILKSQLYPIWSFVREENIFNHVKR